MRLGLSFATRNDYFHKAMHRVYQELKPLLEAFQKIEVVNPTCSSILLGVSDDWKEAYFRVSPNTHDVFQVSAGCPSTADESVLKMAVFERLLKTVRACPLAPQDKAIFEALFEDWRQQHLS
jgi:hypothetical protein